MFIVHIMLGDFLKLMKGDLSKIRPPHASNNKTKLLDLISSMKAHGYKGRPILVFETGQTYQAVTGSHRIAAAKKLKLQSIPIAVINTKQGKMFKETGYKIQDLLRNEMAFQAILDEYDPKAGSLFSEDY